MASTNFIDSQTPVVAAWLNDVNDFVYNGLPPSVDPIITETTSEIISTESSEEFITETS